MVAVEYVVDDDCGERRKKKRSKSRVIFCLTSEEKVLKVLTHLFSAVYVVFEWDYNISVRCVVKFNCTNNDNVYTLAFLY